jgi:hypothetical protein
MTSAPPAQVRSHGLGAIGLFLTTLAAYALLNAGRVDMIDGQYRFEVAKNLLAERSVHVSDPYLMGRVIGADGRAYSPYGLSGSLLALPLVAMARATGEITLDRQQFWFSFTSPVFGAATAALIFIFFCSLGVPQQSALGWSAVSAFATLAFPAATTVFDQSQHAFFVTLSCLSAFLSARRDSAWLAVLGGACVGVLINFQEVYVLLLPTLGLACLADKDEGATARRRGYRRFAIFVAVGLVGLVAWVLFNEYRFGTWLYSGKGTNHPAAFGNPILGLLGLTTSPGKSLLLYSPPSVVALFGLRRLAHQRQRLGMAIGFASATYVALISSLTFYGGDWCWGPRYFVPVLPLFALGLPWIDSVFPANRLMIRGVIALGIAVQLLGLTLDHHRFFYSRSLPAFFWANEPTFYFKHSALLSRPGEIMESARIGVPPEATTFRPGPYPESVTYAVFGHWGDPETPLPVWMRKFKVFWLPRPWPLWLAALPLEQRPTRLVTVVPLLLIIGSLGSVLAYSSAAGLRTVVTSGTTRKRRRDER